MAPKKRKISDLSPDDTTSLLRTLDEFRDALHEDDEDVPAGLIATLDTFRHKLETAKVSLPFAIEICSLDQTLLAYLLLQS